MSVLFVSCTSQQKKFIHDDVRQGQRLFPYGIYQQDANVVVMPPGLAPKNFDFSSVVRNDPEEFLFLGHNSFGFSLFKISQRKGGEIRAESSIDQIKQNEAFFLKVFQLVQLIFGLEKNDPRLKDDRIELQLDKLSATVEFAKYTESGIPEHFFISAPQQYKVEIRTRDVRPLKAAAN